MVKDGFDIYKYYFDICQQPVELGLSPLLLPGTTASSRGSDPPGSNLWLPMKLKLSISVHLWKIMVEKKSKHTKCKITDDN